LKIDITKQHRESKEFSYSIKREDADVVFSGKYKKDGQFLVVDGILEGNIQVVCDLSDQEFFDHINEEINVKFISGVYNGFDQKYDIIEIDGDLVDLNSFLEEEIESFKLGFHRKEDNFKEKEF